MDKTKEMPKLVARKFKIRVPANRLRTTTKLAKRLVRELREQTAMVVALWPLQAEETRRLEAEVSRLQRQLHELEVQEIEIKRKRWCRVCQEEASYMDILREHFYCSTRCERKHKQVYK